MNIFLVWLSFLFLFMGFSTNVQATPSCSFVEINQVTNCDMVETFQLSNNDSNLVLTLNAQGGAMMRYTVEVLGCTTPDLSCGVDVLLLNGEFYQRFAQGHLNFASLMPPGLAAVNFGFLDVNFANSSIMFSIVSTYYFVVTAERAPKYQTLDVKVTIDYNEEPCIGSVLFVYLLIIAISGLWITIYILRNKAVTDIKVPDGLLSDQAYFDEKIESFPIKNCSGKRFQFVSQPPTKFEYWYYSRLLYSWLFYPDPGEVLSVGQRAICIITVVLFNLLCQVYWSDNLQGLFDHLLWNVPIICILQALFAFIYKETLRFVSANKLFGYRVPYLSFRESPQTPREKAQKIALVSVPYVALIIVIILIIVGSIRFINSQTCLAAYTVVVGFFSVEGAASIMSMPIQYLMYHLYIIFGKEIIFENEMTQTVAHVPLLLKQDSMEDITELETKQV